ncbi:hypothetical protein [Alkalihalobacillus sp. BA299]|uniref:hypothetical protein n=1 Tax=Alkalihalobacillus sp. BA299 TaxID=2815938 RepID=UPI001ADA2F88|nr:hypothetical protein [Alkalihalobacillus sp. BA299]
MNTFLELVSMKLAYDRGKETGLAGIVGIIVVLACIALWGYIRPVFEFFGVMNLLDSLGLIHPEEAGMTWFRLLGGFLAFYVIGIIIFLSLLFLVFLFSAISSSKFGKWLEKTFALTFFIVLISPLFVIAIPLFILVGIIECVSYIKNPTEYKEKRKEKKRLNTKKIELQLTSELGIKEQPKQTPTYDLTKELVAQAQADIRGETYTPTPKEKPNYKEDNKITFEEAFQRLNRLPMHGDYRFLIGVTYDRKFYILLPKPLNLAYPRKDVFRAQEIIVNHQLKQLEKGQKITQGEYELVIPNVRSNFENLDYYKIEHYFDIGDAPVYVKQFKNIRLNEPYRMYVNDIQFEYFAKKESLINSLMDPNQKDTYDKNLKEFNELIVGNDEVVSLIRNGNKKDGTTS